MSKKYTTDNITISEALNDGSGVGTSGQVLSSTGSGVSWIDGSGIVGGPYLALSGGTLTGNVRLNDSVQLQIGSSNDAYIIHNGTNTYFVNGVGNLEITNDTNDGDIIFKSDNGSGGLTTYIQIDGSTGAVDLNHYGTKKLETTSTGVEVTGNLDTTGSVSIPDAGKLYLGSGDDLHVYHAGTHGYVLNKTGDLYLMSQVHGGDIIFKTENSSGTAVTPLTLDSAGAATFAGSITAAGGSANNNDDANILTLNASQHARLLVDTSSTGGHRATLALESNGNELTLGTTGSASELTSVGALTVTSSATAFTGNATFAGSITTTSASGITIDTTGNAVLELDGASGNTEAIIFKHSGTEVSRISHSNSTDLVFSTGSSVATALTLSGLTTTFAGSINLPTTKYLRFTSASSNSDATVLFGNTSGTGGSLTFKRNSDSAAILTLNGDKSATFAGVLALPDGSTAAPSIGNTGDTNTGMYWPGNHQVGFAVNGSRKMYMSETKTYFQNQANGVEINNGLTVVSGGIGVTGNSTFAGTIGSGAITSTGQIQGSSFTDGHITWSGAQINRYGAAIELQFTPTNSSTLVKIGAGGSNPTTFNAYTGDATFAGDVAIAQTADVGVLNTTNLESGAAVGLSLTYPTSNVAGGDGLAIAIGIAGRGRSYIANSNATNNLDASNLVFYTEGGGVVNKALTLDTNQNATFAGDVTLSAAGSTGEVIRTTDNTEPYFALQRNSGTNGVGVLRLLDGGDLAFDTGATGAGQATKLTIEAGGNVGILNTSPSSKVHIGSNSTSGALGIGLQNDQRFYTINTDGGSLTFKDESAAAERMRIFSDGDVSIGMTSNYAKLNVNGDVRAENSSFMAGRESAATPAFRFHDDGDTGMFNVNPNILGFSTAGEEKMRITSAGHVGIGTTGPTYKLHVVAASTPIAKFEGTLNGYVDFSDPSSSVRLQNSGHSYFGTQTNTNLNFKTNGSEKMTILAGGNVGIGVTSPGALLEISGIRENQIRLTSYDTTAAVDEVIGGVEFYSSDSGNEGVKASISAIAATAAGDAYMTFSTGTDTEKMRITSAGHIGIGTSSPSTKFHVYNGEATIASSTDGVKLSYSSGNSSGIIDTAFSDNNLEFRTNGTAKMWIANAGTVGIGTISPTARLDVLTNSATGDNDIDRYVRFRADNGEQRFAFNVGRSGNNSSLKMYNSTETQTVNIASGGNSYFNGGDVGIGLTAPEAKLHISGRVYQDGLGNSTFFGFGAGKADDLSSRDNSAFGYQALYTNTTGSSNTATGYKAIYTNTTGHSNTVAGYLALYTNTTGALNTATGAEALRFNTTGNYNTADGYSTLRANTTGGYNTATGYSALYSNTTASYNTASGMNALYANTTGTENAAFGYEALRNTTTASYNSSFGTQALRSNITGYKNTAIGSTSMYANTTGYANTAAGYLSLRYNTTGHHNTAVGFQALRANTTASYNTAVGRDALVSNTTGGQNVAIGYESMHTNTTGSYSVGVGFRALKANTASQGTALGYEALLSNTSGANNVAIGFEALKLNTTGADNTAIGHQAGNSESTATKCVFIGKGADVGGTGTSNQIVIGWGAEGNGSNTVTLGDSNTTEGVFAYGAYQEISDQSVKENVVTIGNALSKVKAMRGVTYNKIGRETTKVGVIAQEMELVLPEVVAEGSGGLKSVAYGNIVAVLIEAMKEQQVRIEALEAQLNNQ